jgi:hypothetical protein
MYKLKIMQSPWNTEANHNTRIETHKKLCCESWGSQSSVSEYSILLWCDNMSLDEQSPDVLNWHSPFIFGVNQSSPSRTEQIDPLDYNLGWFPTWCTKFLFTYNTFIKILYMFRALPCSSSGGLRHNCIYVASGIVTVCRCLSCTPVKKELVGWAGLLIRCQLDFRSTL